MKIKRKEWQQFVPRPLEEVWQFFSRPENLNELTPTNMSFEIVSPIAGRPMYEGMLVLYRISPFLGIKMDWATEITHIDEGRYSVDEQRFGPYAMWHHEHHFELQEGGVMMTDLLHYKIPYGFIGSLADALLVDAQVGRIFEYRRQAIERLFS